MTVGLILADDSINIFGGTAVLIGVLVMLGTLFTLFVKNMQWGTERVDEQTSARIQDLQEGQKELRNRIAEMAQEIYERGREWDEEHAERLRLEVVVNKQAGRVIRLEGILRQNGIEVPPDG